MASRKLKTFDNSLQVALSEGYSLVAGVDEAGRGCLAGPVCAAAVIMPEGDFSLSGIDDSKKLSRKKREELYEFITAEALSYGVGFVSEREIDEINILQATYRAMRKALASLTPQPELTLIDGNRFDKTFPKPYKTIIKGDSLCISIAAASIVAKVERDRYMFRLAEEAPREFDFANNVGYGAKKHLEALALYGPTPWHRRAFIKKRLGASRIQESLL